MVRRLVDVVVAGVGLMVAAPVIALVAVAIKLDSPGPVFYRGSRVGKDGKPFSMWKFRTMEANTRHGPQAIATLDDPRITRVGTLLRRTRIDELPQLINVLAGDMSLVGPRPEIPEIVARYTREQLGTLAVKPGVTSPGTLHYSRHQVHTIPDGAVVDDYYVEHLLPDKLALELDYLRNRSWRRDLGIIAETVGYVLRPRRPTGGVGPPPTPPSTP